MFRFTHIPMLALDLFLRGYGQYEPVVTGKNDRWDCLFSGKTLEKLSEEGFGYALQEGFFGEYEKEAQRIGKLLVKQSEVDLDKLSDQELIALLEKFFDTAGVFLELYSKTEFIFFPRIEKKLLAFTKDKFSVQDVLSKKVDIGSWPKQERMLAEYIMNMQHLKFELRKIVNSLSLGPDSFLAKIIEQLVIRLKREDAPEMTFNEIKRFFSGENISDVSYRKKYAYITYDNDNKTLAIADYKESQEKLESLQKEVLRAEVKGMPTCKGVVKGRARVLNFSLEPAKYLSKVEKGDIIVVGSTGPEMVVIMKKVAGIVADEGGLMSHAALISRELNIPCVIGTKHATEVFKDGDYLELDANKGVVRIIKEKSK